LTSCSVWLPDNLGKQTLPGYPNSSLAQDTETYCPEELSLALNVFTLMWDKYTTNSALPENIGQLDLVVSNKLLNHPDGLASGITYTQEEQVRVEFSTVTSLGGEEKQLHDTALFHELVHVGLFYDYGDADSNHSESGGPWTDKHTELVEHVENVFQGLNYKTICDI
jgi:hypothetical protein